MKKKHIIALACVLALVVSLMSSFAFAAAPEEGASVNAGNSCYVKTETNLYKIKSVNATIITHLYPGEQLVTYSTNNDATWRHARKPNMSDDGYVQRAHIIEPG